MAESKTEKMRKLFADNQVSTEQLENVAGGGVSEMADDSRFLNVLLRGRPFQCDRYGETKCDYDWYEKGDEIALAWDSVGIKVQFKKEYCSEYWDNETGRAISRDHAMALAQKRVGKTLKKSDWYWDKK